MNHSIASVNCPRQSHLAACLFFAVSLCSMVGCGSVDETEAVAALKKMGVITSKNSDGTVNSLANLPVESAQLTEALDHVAKLGDPRSVTILDGSGVNASHIATLASIDGLVHLEIQNADIGDADIEPIYGHSKLESLILIKSKITAAAMKKMSTIPKLGLLSISDTQVDGGFESLQKLKKFEYLIIGGLTIDEEDAKAISSNTTITHVTMNNTDISEAALKILRSNPNCTVDGTAK